MGGCNYEGPPLNLIQWVISRSFFGMYLEHSLVSVNSMNENEFPHLKLRKTINRFTKHCDYGNA